MYLFLFFYLPILKHVIYLCVHSNVNPADGYKLDKACEMGAFFFS